MDRSLRPIRPNVDQRDGTSASTDFSNEAEKGRIEEDQEQQGGHPDAAGAQSANGEAAGAHGAGVDGEEVAVDEARRPRIQGSPYKPTKSEIAEHKCTHWPF